jgi:hypothetical protein
MNKTCERCKTEFTCESNNPNNQPCWCFSLPPISLPNDSFNDCLCKNCLLEFKKKNEDPLNKKENFYFENGLMVLTEVYLKKRGFCCGNDCRHCPY